MTQYHLKKLISAPWTVSSCSICILLNFIEILHLGVLGIWNENYKNSNLYRKYISYILYEYKITFADFFYHFSTLFAVIQLLPLACWHSHLCLRDGIECVIRVFRVLFLFILTKLSFNLCRVDVSIELSHDGKDDTDNQKQCSKQNVLGPLEEVGVGARKKQKQYKLCSVYGTGIFSCCVQMEGAFKLNCYRKLVGHCHKCHGQLLPQI